MEYTPPADDSLKVSKLRPYEKAGYVVQRDKTAKAVQRGLAKIKKEDRYSIKRLIRTIREETLAIRLSERLEVQLWRNMYTEIIDGTTYLVQPNHATREAQKIPLREWWVRQLT